MRQKFIIVDAMNLFFRSIHTVNPASGVDSMIGMAYSIILNSLRKAHRDLGVDHVVFCLDGKSWRKQVAPTYKLNRTVARAEQSDRDRETQEILFGAFNDFCEFIDTSTNITLLRAEGSEADDLIAVWIQEHPEDEHIISSTDTDFLQLIAPNVTMYNGVTKTITTLEGVFTDDGKPFMDKKTKAQKITEEPEYYLFKKCIRGDKSDNIFSAYPGVREKGTKNKVGIIEAYEDRHTKGFAWNNFMLQKWEDHHGIEHKVKDDYALNKQLIDLTQQPDEIKEACKAAIAERIAKEKVSQVGIKFLKFCGTWDLQRIANNANTYTGMLNDKYIERA